MKYSYSKRKDNKKYLIVVVIFAVIIFFSFLLNKKMFNKFIEIVYYPIEYVSNIFNDISLSFETNKSLRKENENLKLNIDNLNYKLLENQAIIDENMSLRKMLDIKEEYSHLQLVYSKIITRQIDDFKEILVINKGSKDGIKLNQTVIHKNGLVGYVSEIYDSIAYVTTIFDNTSIISSRVSSNDSLTILKNDINLKTSFNLKLENISNLKQISIGDIVYTSLNSYLYKPSIPIGTVTKIINNKNDIDRYAIVKPTVDLYSISEVAVIVN